MPADTNQNSLPESPWAPLPDRKNQRAIKREAVLRTAARMFLARGPGRVTMNEVAEALNITKPALYNYFKSKDEIVLECYRLGYQMAISALDDAESTDATGLEKLRRFMEGYAVIATIDFGACMIRFDDRGLPDRARGEVKKYKREIDERVRQIVTTGIEDGSIYPCDTRLVTFAIFGVLNAIGTWYSPDGPETPQRIGAVFADMLIGPLGPVQRR